MTTKQRSQTATMLAGEDDAPISKVVDSHCHIWQHWPYQPAVPDPETSAVAAQLLWQMDQHGVDHAVVIAAALGGNAGNAAYAFAEAAALAAEGRARLTVFADLESRWSPEYGAPGAAARLQAALARWPQMRGFTLYPAEAETGDWFLGSEGRAFFGVAERAGLIASLSLLPHQFQAAAELARRHPAMTFLLHHHGFLGPRSGTGPADVDLVQPLAMLPNIWVKLSGLGNCAGPEDDYPYPNLRWSGQLFYDLFGPQRLVWGSDFPVSSQHMTYRQSMDVLRRYGPGTKAEKALMLGGNMARLLGI